MNDSPSSKIAHEYASASRGTTVIKLSTKFDQKNFIDANRKYAESLSDELNKPLLKDYYIEQAAKGGLCSAAVM
jgi:hypothetical protein